MKTSIALLRGINVSGQKKVPMKELATLFEGLGFRNVKTYIQSGNVVFDHPAEKPALLSAKIEKQILKTFGFEVPVVIVSPEDLITAVKESPYVKGKSPETEKIYFIFTDSIPDAARVKEIEKVKFENEKFSVVGTVIHLWVANGYGNAKLNNNYFENKLKLKATTRNWKTVQALIDLSEEK
jgi:uncharacterized protein (DUF1697 family)